MTSPFEESESYIRCEIDFYLANAQKYTDLAADVRPLVWEELKDVIEIANPKSAPPRIDE